MYRIVFLLLVCSLLPIGTAQEAENSEKTNTLYESLFTPDRSLTRRLEQADRLLDAGRTTETAQLLGTILETTNYPFIIPPPTEEEPDRTLHQTLNDDIIDRLRRLPKEAKDLYTFQYEPTARRLLDNAADAGSLDDVVPVARKYFPTTSGATATFLIGLSQFERGDYAAAFLTLDRLQRLHPAVPDSLKPALEKILKESQANMQHAAEMQRQTSASAWLEQSGWQIPPGTPSQNISTKATAPLLEKNWTVPIFHRIQWKQETDLLVRLMRSRHDVYIPASQPLVVGDLFITRTPPGETIAVDAHSGKRLWIVGESEYRRPEGGTLPLAPTSFHQSLRPALRLYFWHDRIAQQLSSDGERLFSVDGHDIQGGMQRLPNLEGRGEDLRYAPGNTLTARNVKTGQILWQVGKFPYVQKYINDILGPRQRNIPAGQVTVDENIFTDDEKVFFETTFLGAPLPLQGRLYVIGETDGLVQLFVLEPQTGRLIVRQPFAHVGDSSAIDIRRTYPLFPSAAEGIVVCGTGSGVIAALDATTLTPIWCYTYSPATRPVEPNRRNAMNLMRQRQLPLFHRTQNEDAIKHIFAESGWQVPSMMIDGQRVLVAPPDRPTLFCLDLVTGEFLWEQTVSRGNTLYVAGIHNDKAFLVTPVNIMTIDMTTGEDLTTIASRFPANLKPAGIGVRSGEQYFIPFTDGHLAVADLNDGTLTWLDASGAAIVPLAEELVAEELAADEVDMLRFLNDMLPEMLPIPPLPAPPLPVPPLRAAGGGEWRFEGRIEIQIGDNVVFERQIRRSGIPGNEQDADSTATVSADDAFRQPIQFGNLVGIKGRFFSQSPTQISSFYQKEPLRQRAEALLQADANDPEGLLYQGRILKSEGKLTEAIESFRASLKVKHTVEAADALRRNLLEAMRKDYPTWAHASEELESLAEFPEEWGEILHAQIEGALQSGAWQSGNKAEIAAILEKVFAFGQNHTMLIPVSADHSAQLHRALSCLAEQSIAMRPELKSVWEELAEMFLLRFTVGIPSSARAHSFAFTRYTGSVEQPAEVQRWSMFTHIFRNTASAERAKENLCEAYVQHRLPLALVLREKTPQPSWSELPPPLVWKSKVDVQEVPLSTHLQNLPPAQDRNEIDQIVARLVANAQNPGITRPGDAPMPLPVLSPLESESELYNYFIKQGPSGFFLCRSDLAGREQWRVALPPTISTGYTESQSQAHNNRYNGEFATYIKGLGNYRLLVHGTSMIAVDTTPQSEGVLWSKVLTSMPFSTLASARINNVNQRPNLGMMPFPKSSVFVSPYAVCYWDANGVHALDPLTGQTLWTRKILYNSCTILGDDDNLFLAFPDARQVVAVDPISGRELANAGMPDGGIYIYGTNIAFMQQSGGNYSLKIADLRDIHDRERRARMVSNTPGVNLLTETLDDGVRSVSMLQTFGNDRFLSVATWDTKSLQVYDLLTKKKLLPENNKILEFVPPENMSGMRCDVEIVGDRFLVLFTKGTNIRNTNEVVSLGEEGRRVRRNFRQVNNVMGVSIDVGAMMLFDSEGNACWAEPVLVEKMFRLLDVPDCLPVMLFAIAADDTVVENVAQRRLTSIWLMGVDKRSGETLFREEFVKEKIPLEPFRVGVDVLSREIIFMNTHVSPLRAVKAVFGE